MKFTAKSLLALAASVLMAQPGMAATELQRQLEAYGRWIENNSSLVGDSGRTVGARKG